MFWFICEWAIVCARAWATKQAGNSARAKKKTNTNAFQSHGMIVILFFFVRLSISMNLLNFCQLTAIRDYDKATHSLLDAIYYSPIWWFYAWVTKGILNNSTIVNSTKWYQNLPKFMNKDIFHYLNEDIDSSAIHRVSRIQELRIHFTHSRINIR